MLKKKRRAGKACILLNDDESLQGRRVKTSSSEASRGPSLAPRSASGSGASTSAPSAVRARFEKKLFSQKVLPKGTVGSFSKGKPKPAENARRAQHGAGGHRGGQRFGNSGGSVTVVSQSFSGRPPPLRPPHLHRQPLERNRERHSANNNSSFGSAKRRALERLVLGGLLFNPNCQETAGKPKPLPGDFSSHDEYVKSYEPLLLEEARAKLISDWEDNCENDRLHAATLLELQDLSSNISHKDLHNANTNATNSQQQQNSQNRQSSSSQQAAKKDLESATPLERFFLTEDPARNNNSSSSNRNQSSGTPRSMTRVSNHLKLTFEHNCGKKQRNCRLSELMEGDVLVFMDRPPPPKHMSVSSWLASELKRAKEKRQRKTNNATMVGGLKSGGSSSDHKVQEQKKKGEEGKGSDQDPKQGDPKEQKAIMTSNNKNKQSDKKTALYMAHAQCFAGLVKQAIRSESRKDILTIDIFPLCPQYPHCGGECCEHVNMSSLRARMERKHTFWFTKCGNLVTAVREFSALHNLKISPLLNSILKPKGAPEEKEKEEVEPIELPPECSGQTLEGNLRNRFNPGQYKAVCTAASHMAQALTGSPIATTTITSSSSSSGRRLSGPGFTLVHGPPGTGKTHTIWGILNVVHLACFQRYYNIITEAVKSKLPSAGGHQRVGAGGYNVGGGSKLSKQQVTSLYNRLMDEDLLNDKQKKILQDSCPKPRILVCAPSNAAVDELCKRVVGLGFQQMNGQNYTPDIVRVSSKDYVLSSATAPVSDKQRASDLLKMDHEEYQRQWHVSNNKVTALNRDIKIVMVQIRQISQLLAKGQGNMKEAELQGHSQQLDGLLIQLVRFHENRDKHQTHMERLLCMKDTFSYERGGGGNREYERARVKLENSFVEEAEIVFCTLSTSANKVFSKLGLKFQCVLIDEAAQASEMQTLQPLQYGARHCVLVGDPQQLPATVISKHATQCNYDRSLLERLSQAGCPNILLCKQFRMLPGIREFPSNYFYKGQLQDGENITQLIESKRATVCQIIEAPNSPADPKRVLAQEDRSLLDEAYTLFHVEGLNTRSNGSLGNREEVRAVVGLYDYLMNNQIYCPEPGKKENKKQQLMVGIITPYKYQKRLLEDAFVEKYGFVGAGSRACNVRIDTIDSFQGKERDIVILSCVRSQSHKSKASLARQQGRQQQGSSSLSAAAAGAASSSVSVSASGGGGNGIGFVSDVRRMNVAITRAKHLLWIVGDMDVLTQNEAWKALIENARERKRVRFDLKTQLRKWSNTSPTTATTSEPKKASTATSTAASVPPPAAAASVGVGEKGEEEEKEEGEASEEEEGECFWENRVRKKAKRDQSKC